MRKCKLSSHSKTAPKSLGVARMINKVCTHCLFYGAQNQHRIIDDHMVKRVIEGELS